MKLKIGERVILLENRSFIGGGKPEPMAAAEIISYNANNSSYLIRYTLYSNGTEGEVEVPAERLLPVASAADSLR